MVKIYYGGKTLDEICQLARDHFYCYPLAYDFFKSLCYDGKMRKEPVVPEEISYLTGFKEWYVGFPERSKFRDVILSRYEDALVIELTYSMLFNYEIWEGLIDRSFLWDITNFYLEAEKHVPNHISVNDKIYIIHPIYRLWEGDTPFIENRHDIEVTKIMLVFRHFEHCDLRSLRVLFDLIEYWLGDYAEWDLQEFSCNAEKISFVGYVEETLEETNYPFKGLIKQYMASHIVGYAFMFLEWVEWVNME